MPSTPFFPWVQEWVSALSAALEVQRSVADDGERAAKLYADIYAAGWRANDKPSQFNISTGAAGHPSFTEWILAFSKKTYEAGGWELLSMEGDVCYLKKRGVTTAVKVKELSKISQDNNFCSVIMPVINKKNPAFLSRSNGIPREFFDFRIYFPLTTDTAPWLIASCGDEFDLQGLEYELKVPAHPAQYWRYDAGVVYCNRGTLMSIMQIISSRESPLHRSNKKLLFTLPLGERVSVACQPKNNKSHGQWVCNLLSEAIIQGLDVKCQIEFVVDRIRSEGRDCYCPGIYEEHIDLLALCNERFGVVV